MNRAVLRAAAVWFTLATLFFLQPWLDLAKAPRVYFLRRSPLITSLLPLALAEAAVLLGALAIYVLLRKSVRFSEDTQRKLFLVISMVAIGAGILNAVRFFNAHDFVFVLNGWLRVLCVCVGAVVLWASFRWPQRAELAYRETLLIAFPFALFLILRALYFIAPLSPRMFADPADAPSVQAASDDARVIVMVLDEMSYDVAFGPRPADLRMPVFDSLKQRSFFATQATSPAYQTVVSIPALITGTQLQGVTPETPNSMTLVTASGDHLDWSNTPTMFDDARRAGVNSGVSGWYHPYGRLFAGKVQKAYWYPGQLEMEGQPPSSAPNLAEAAIETTEFQVLQFPFLGHTLRNLQDRWQKQQRVECASTAFQHGLKMATDPSLGFVFIHLPVPHPPGFWDRDRHAFTTGHDGTYLDNLSLADDIVGKMIESIRKAGLGSRTVLIITSDHGWRTTLWEQSPDWSDEEIKVAGHNDEQHVPFIVWFGNSETPVIYSRQFNTVATRGLVQHLLTNEVHNAVEVGAYLDKAPNPEPLRRSKKYPAPRHNSY